MARELIKGNVAVAEAAVRAGLVSYFGYPITPQTELLEYLSGRMPELGRAFVQAESELGAINMVYGAACTGRRTMTSSSSPGISLMQEGLSYIACTELPVVVVNVVRGGPGLGNIAPSQGDYNQATRGGGHGEYHQLVLAPASVQEAVDLTTLAFDLAEKYRNIVMILMDGSLGQMMEPAELPPFQPIKTEVPDWAVNGESGRAKRVLTSINIDPPAQERTNIRLMSRWQEIEANEVRFKGYYLEDAEYVVIGYGTAGRIALSAVRTARENGIKVGLLRPITVAPFPVNAIEALIPSTKAFLVVEMNNGQMLEDVRLVISGRKPIAFYGRMGGVVPYPDDVLREIQALISPDVSFEGHPRDRWLAQMRAEFGTGA
ncbi:MAG TPA: 3-methyl-2-oxobutanoate dehydrogenase subunit VorB [Anaerolineaceae bacterium]|jgi:2-oxoglutarate ferredoxin oxidoreductase subunit alpha|nr:3-methyl-2-oxobutanoate dehydrogenase subunit VorB [Anaerolineaceae bacterium]HOR83897.1 3-methyl-2-oxobutanoate dehydrogenase subunit VorB [Anaerolineaceae bacterium]HPL42233.1 3-methyl-2-oxobutanoate dehydrogenase subunit VorB [Anaerolineaceae bacterium]HPY32721.1 3-methyl-2-oxobutanoate dehydrogenase subunit VorB [Anaerolineaceae bacterium]HQC20987.1 3-methyl-2-oxobutanoate dehydrogenase subunit VorB [Anaerolineaceae bacterium]